VGTGEGALHPLAVTSRVVVSNWRITDADKVGEGSPKQKFRQNVAAIELLRWIESENRSATDAERAILVKYVGWGGLPQVFAEASEAPQWRKEQKLLKDLLLPDEYRSARATVLNAHYTSPTVIRGMYVALERLGFGHGRVLEPACGLGHFFGLMPEAMRSRSELTGIEIDPLTARLASQLYPQAEIRATAFEEASLRTNYYDVAISNVPFGDYAPFDPRLNKQKYRIHDYFFFAALERVRPGGLVLFITSRGTLDKRQSGLRELLAQSADLVGAIRLPNDVFKQNANTEVTTDIVILRKRAPGEVPSSAVAWLETRPLEGSTSSEGAEDAIWINEYYHANPHMLLGRMQREEHGMYGRNEVGMVSDGRDLVEAMASAIVRLPSGIYQPLTETQAMNVRQTLPVANHIKPYSYALTDEGAIARREGEDLVVLTGLSANMARRMRGMIRIRDAVRACLQVQVENRPDDEITAARLRLNQDYDHFVGQFGPVSQSANTRAFWGDPDLPLLLSLENFNEDTKLAAKTAIFHERTIQARQPVERVETAREALLVTLNDCGRVDLDAMSRLLGKPTDEFLPELAGMIYLNPETERWETADEYLSGNVRNKLFIAEGVAEVNAKYRPNVEALQSVQPTDLKASEIDARLGAVWIPPQYIEHFIQELLEVSGSDPNSSVSIRHVSQLGLWSVTLGYFAKNSVGNLSGWGTERVPAHELIEHALNLRTPTVYDLDPDKNRILNVTATEGAREKQGKIREKFATWIWEDDARRERLTGIYNRSFNSNRLRTFDGSHLTLSGASPTITLRPHQKAAVWRILQTPNTLLAHVVGAGKSFVMIAAAMELKRIGLAKKPLFAVPNHMLGQFSSELLALYPNANILAAGKADFEKAKRQQLMARIATGNWDAVIVTHSGFERLGISKEARERFIEEQLDELENCIREQKKDKADVRLVKELERAKKRLEGRLKDLSAEDRKDTMLTFEELGVDRLFVDEAHTFKNLFYVTKMTRVAGLPQSASERAFDMFLKVQHVQRQNDGGGVVFATGTPVTNTMAEMFTLKRFLQMELLRDRQLAHFDSWAATFGETVTAMELAPDGAGYRLNTRFARFVNVPELMQIFRQTADVQTADMLKLPVPELEGGKAQVVRAPSTPALKAFVESLVKRAERLKTGNVDPSEDNMLKITGEGRKAALDLRLVMPFSSDHPNSKVNQAVNRIFAVWDETRAQRLTQLVFCDLSTPKAGGRGFSVYDDIKAKLVRQGVPSEEIAFIQDYDTDAAKAALFKDVRSGKVRILLGSTQKMGAGTNVQKLLVAEHHLDAPWRPADIEQREGRILRQGNTNPVVKIFRYVTEGSFDAFMWQTLETKAKFISQVMQGQTTVRRIEDLDAPALTYAEMKAIASGNPLVIEKARVDTEVMRLSRLRAEHAEAQYTARGRVRRMTEDVALMEKQIAGMEKDLAVRADTSGDKFSVIVDRHHFTERPEAGTALIKAVESMLDKRRSEIVMQIAGFNVEFRHTAPETLTIRGAMNYTANVSPSPVGIIASVEHAIRSIDERLAARQKDFEQTQKNLVSLSALVGKPFEYEERLNELTARQAELLDVLDITKNQAAGLSAETDAGEGETLSVTASDSESEVKSVVRMDASEVIQAMRMAV
jgi:N12 class adenine-specific DNA methylase/adenine-specific DNA methylase